MLDEEIKSLIDKNPFFGYHKEAFFYLKAKELMQLKASNWGVAKR